MKLKGKPFDLCHPCTHSQNINPKKMKGLKMEKFFCLSSDGLIYFLGQFNDWEDAELFATERKIDSIWLCGEDFAKSWKDTLKENLS
jgi:hypothetical protein